MAYIQTPTPSPDEIYDMWAKGLLVHAACSWKAGYISRKSPGIVKPYKGRYGQGYTVETPSRTSTRYHYITYYV